MNQDAEKQAVARRAVQFVQDGMRVGLGSGSTSAHAVRFLGERIRNEGLKIIGVPTSPACEEVARMAGVPLAADRDSFALDLAIDGADEATRDGALIKGGGGALLHERIVAAAAKRFVVICDSSKLVEQLGSAILPVEVFRFGWRNAAARIEAEGGQAAIRVQSDGSLFVSEEGNYILDCVFPPETMQRTSWLNQFLRTVPGVADHGLFLGMADLMLVAHGERVEEIPLVRG